MSLSLLALTNSSRRPISCYYPELNERLSAWKPTLLRENKVDFKRELRLCVSEFTVELHDRVDFISSWVKAKLAPLLPPLPPLRPLGPCFVFVCVFFLTRLEDVIVAGWTRLRPRTVSGSGRREPVVFHRADIKLHQRHVTGRSGRSRRSVCVCLFVFSLFSLWWPHHHKARFFIYTQVAVDMLFQLMLVTSCFFVFFLAKLKNISWLSF